MREIYSHCAADVVWLGAENSEYSRGLKLSGPLKVTSLIGLRVWGGPAEN
jgi:hypothetical protein